MPVGAKQNRILSRLVLIAAHSKTKIPVSCVEQGRWRYRSRRFGSSGSHSSSKLRYFLKESVTRSVMAKRGDRSDQGKLWQGVARQQSALGTASPTHAMADTFDAYADKVADFRKELQYIDGACGLAVAVGATIVAVDLFDKATTCRKVWQRLLSQIRQPAEIRRAFPDSNCDTPAPSLRSCAARHRCVPIGRRAFGSRS